MLIPPEEMFLPDRSFKLATSSTMFDGAAISQRQSLDKSSRFRPLNWNLISYPKIKVESSNGLFVRIFSHVIGRS
jgi:hypothetical protein